MKKIGLGKRDFDGGGCAASLIVILLVLGSIVSIRQGLTLPQAIRQLVEFSEQTPYPTVISGVNQETANNATNNTSVVIQIATPAPFAPTLPATPTPAPTATPQPTATAQATPTPLWGYAVGTSEALERRIDALENAPAPQVERIGFVHWGTLGTSFVALAIIGLLVSLASSKQPLIVATANQPQATPKPPLTAPDLVINQSVTTSNQPDPVSNPVVIQGLTALQAGKLTKARGRIKAKSGAVDRFDIPHPRATFTDNETATIRHMAQRHGFGVNVLCHALWGQKTSQRMATIKEIIGG